MSVSGFLHYNLSAHREVLDQLRDFYVRVVGLRLGPRPPLRRFGYWLYAGEVAVLHLSEASAGDRRDPHVSGTFNHAALSCTGYQAARERLRSNAVEVREVLDPLLAQRQLFFKDPAGNGVELVFALDDED